METKTAASAIPGNDMMMSSTRMMHSDMDFLLTAAIEPMIEPHTSAIAVAPKPMMSE